MALLLLLTLSAFFSASETAYSCINRIRMQNLAEDGDENARLALRIAEDFDRMLSTILIGNNVVNLSASSIATVVATVLLGASTGPAVSTLVMTILVLIFGEVMPKSYAKAHAEEIALKVAKPLAVLQTVLAPLSWLFMKLQRAVSRRGEQEPSVTEQELKTIIQNSEEEGVL
ncbi:DUF21 domain-containing protein, partial [Ligaoa zhengdingensis]